MTQPNPVEMMREALEAVAADLAAEVEHRYADTKDHPAIQGRYKRDMEPVQAARAALAEMERWEQVALGMNAYQSESDCVHPRWVLDHDGYANREPMPAILLVRKP